MENTTINDPMKTVKHEMNDIDKVLQSKRERIEITEETNKKTALGSAGKMLGREKVKLRLEEFAAVSGL